MARSRFDLGVNASMLDLMTEAEWEACFVDIVVKLGGMTNHAFTSNIGGRSLTASELPLPDRLIWFPHAAIKTGVHFVELKTNSGKLSTTRRVKRGNRMVLRHGQDEVFGSMEAAGCPVHVWRPRDLDAVVIPTLQGWAQR